VHSCRALVSMLNNLEPLKILIPLCNNSCSLKDKQLVDNDTERDIGSTWRPN
jgi:hypothetical protein